MKPKEKHKQKSREKQRKMPQDSDAAAATKQGLLPVQEKPDPEAVVDIQRPITRVSRLNQRFVLLVAVCSLVLAAGMHGVRHFQLNRNAEIYRNRATTLQKEGKPNEAIIYLSRYLQFRPDDVDARATLGILIKKELDNKEESNQDPRKWQSVFLIFEEVVSRDPDRSDIRRELVDVAMKLGRFGSALNHLKILRKSAPDDGELAFRSAVCHQAEGHLAEAAKDYSKSIEQPQNEFAHYDAFARFVVEEFDKLSSAERQTILEVSSRQSERPANEAEPPEPNAIVVADNLLDLMVRRGLPAYKARLARAQFPYPANTLASNSPMQRDAAKNWAAAVLHNLDTNQDESLDHTEWITATFVPSMVDSNGDRIISDQELTDHYEQGSDYARLDFAQSDVEVALDLVDSVAPDLVDSREKIKVYYAAAQISIALGQIAPPQGKPDEGNPHLQKARDYAENGLGQEQLDLRFYLLLSDIEVLEGKPDAAEKHLRAARAALKQSSQSPEKREVKKIINLDKDLEDQLQWALADLLISKIESNQTGASQSELSEDQKKELNDILEELDESQPRVKYLNGRMRFTERKWHTAGLALEEARRDLEENVAIRRQIDRILAVCYQRLSNPDAQINVWRRALKQDPLWVDGHVRLGTALAAFNRVDDALAEYQSVRFVPGVPTAMAGLLLRKQSALQEGRRELGWRNIQRALDAEVGIRKQFDLPLPAAVPILRAELQRLQKNYPEAKHILEKYRDENPEDAKIWAALSSLHLLNTDLDEAEKVLSEAQHKLGDRIELKLAAMQIAVAKPVDEAKTILNSIDSETKNFEKSERIQILKGLAAAYARIASHENVSIIWSQLVHMQPDDLRTLLVSAELSLKENDPQKWKESLNAIRTVEGDDGPNGNYIEAMRLLRQAEQDLQSKNIELSKSEKVVKARVLLTSAAVQRPMWEAVPSALGHLENSLNNWDAALAHFRTALAVGSRSKSVIVSLVQILRMEQRHEEANQILSQLRNENPSLVSGELARIHSLLVWQLDDHDEALKIAVENAEDSDDVLNTIFKAMMIFAGDPLHEDVEKLLRNAVSNAMENQHKQLRVATYYLVEYLSKVNKLDGEMGAEAAIAEASNYLSTEPPALALLTLAYCYEVLHGPGRENRHYLKKAEEQYLNALKSKSDDSEIGLQMKIVDFYSRTGQLAKATDHLNQIRNSKITLSLEVRDWANQRRAILLASLGGYAATKQALEMLTSKDSDLRAMAVLLSRLSFKDDQRELIKVLERIDKTLRKLTQSERLRLAQLYEMTGDWPKSRETIQRLLDDDLSNPQLLEYAVLALLRHHHDNDEESVLLDEAERLADRLDALEANSFRTNTTRFRLLAAQDQAAQAVKLLKNYFAQIPDEQNNAQKIADRNSAASLLEKLEQFQAADEMYRKYVELSPQPEAVLPLISFLGRRKKHAEALVLCEKSWETVSTARLSAVAMAIIRDGQVTGRHVQRVEQRLKMALEKDRHSLPLLLILADLHDFQGQYDRVESIYRLMLEIEQNNIVALNNFAWLLAIRHQRGDDALSLINRAIDRVGPISELLDTRAVVLLAANKPQDALGPLNKAIEQKPSPIKTFHLAQVYFELSNYSASKKALKKAEDEGLNWDQMHPLERKEWEKLQQNLENR